MNEYIIDSQSDMSGMKLLRQYTFLTHTLTGVERLHSFLQKKKKRTALDNATEYSTIHKVFMTIKTTSTQGLRAMRF